MKPHLATYRPMESKIRRHGLRRQGLNESVQQLTICRPSSEFEAPHAAVQGDLELHACTTCDLLLTTNKAASTTTSTPSATPSDSTEDEPDDEEELEGEESRPSAAGRGEHSSTRRPVQ